MTSGYDTHNWYFIAIVGGAMAQRPRKNGETQFIQINVSTLGTMETDHANDSIYHVQ